MGILHEYECAIRPGLKGKAHGGGEGIARRVAAITRGRFGKMDDSTLFWRERIVNLQSSSQFLVWGPAIPEWQRIVRIRVSVSDPSLIGLDFFVSTVPWSRSSTESTNVNGQSTDPKTWPFPI